MWPSINRKPVHRCIAEIPVNWALAISALCASQFVGGLTRMRERYCARDLTAGFEMYKISAVCL